MKCKVTKSIFELLNNLESPDINPRTLLIEGAPGIGKTFLLRHVAFEWANGRILKSSHLVFLLCLRDPTVQDMSTISDLVFYFYKLKQDEAASKRVESLCTYLLNSNGKSITFLIDGYDELPEKLQKDSFVASIITHQVLPASAVVLTSHPHATAHLHDKVAYLITILGFAEEDRGDYVRETLKNQPDKILTYLNNHPIIDKLCYIPFNLTVLMFLYKKGFTLPENTTQLYKYFICLTIRRYFSKHHIKQTFKNLDNLPDPYRNIIDNLAALSYTALGKQQITFTLEEIRTACPDIDTIPEGINGLGLLQAVQHFGFIEETTTVNFLHLSLQEYLAAYHIAHLPSDEELLVLHDNFLRYNYRNTFLLYLGLTEGQHSTFKYFLSGGGRYNGTASMLVNKLFSDTQNNVKISSRFLNSLYKILYLFRSFYEAKDKSWCDAIVNCTFFYDSDGKKYFNYCIGDFLQMEDQNLLIAYTQEWFLVEFNTCCMTDAILKRLHHALVVQSPVINTLHIHYCKLNTATQMYYIAEIVTLCHIKKLNVYLNIGSGLDNSEWIIQMLSHKKCALEELNLSLNSLTSKTVCEVLSYIKSNKAIRLNTLDITGNPIDDSIADEIDACVMLQNVFLDSVTSVTTVKLFSNINMSRHSNLKNLTISGNFTGDRVTHELTTCFLQNRTLMHLDLCDVKDSDDATLHIVNALHYNTTLRTLKIGIYCRRYQVKKIKSKISIINRKRHFQSKHLPKLSCDIQCDQCYHDRRLSFICIKLYCYIYRQ